MPGPAAIVDLTIDVKPYCGVAATDTSKDAVLTTFINAGTTWANHWFGNVVQSTVTEQHDGGDTIIHLREAPVVSVTTLTEIIGGVVWTLTLQPVGAWVDQFGFSIDYPNEGIITRRTVNSAAYLFTPGNGNITVTYVSGRATVPADIKLAVLDDIRSLFNQTQVSGKSAFGPAGGEDVWHTGPGHMFPRLAALADSALRLPAIG